MGVFVIAFTPRLESMREVQLPEDDGSLEAQLVELYTDRQMLLERLGTADPRQIIAMVESLEAQLFALYAERDTGDSGLPTVLPDTTG